MAIRARKPKRHVSTRIWHPARYRALGDHRGTLEPGRGGRVITICLDTLAELVNAKDAAVRLFARAGDRLLAMGAAVEDIAMLIVERVEPLQGGWRDRLWVEAAAGQVRAGEVKIMKVNAAQWKPCK